MTVKFQNWRRFAVLIGMVVVAGLAAMARAVAVSVPDETDIRRDATVRATEEVLPCVVNIATATVVQHQDFYEDLLRQFYGYDRKPPRKEERLNSIGSGVIIDEDGYILTNFHVLRRATRVQVKLWDGRIYDADPIVYTPLKDVALLKIRSQPGEKFKAVKFAEDDDLLLGETVLALGNPYGLGGSVTRGILSSKNRRLTAGNEPLSAQDWLQTDADINPGNSGGPLVNLRGELIGINVAVYREQQGMGVGFAIPVKQVAGAMADFFSPEVMSSLWFGARVKPGSIPIEIASVQAGSPAHRAGLRSGQKILQVDGTVPRNIVDFNRLVSRAANRSTMLQVAQDSEQRAIAVQMVTLEDMIRQKLGLVLTNLTAETAATFNVRAGEALIIREVEKGGPADRAQLQSGYLLTGMDGQNMANLLAAANVISSKGTGDTMQLAVLVPSRTVRNTIQLRKGTATLQVR